MDITDLLNINVGIQEVWKKQGIIHFLKEESYSLETFQWWVPSEKLKRMNIRIFNVIQKNKSLKLKKF